mmetsp:Transcript_31689/g.68426  ORF Transcript_31689/g.68426 Transcript_31689/m.68426 type:complete len:88 (-) Transcript_31689:118-381(-)
MTQSVVKKDSASNSACSGSCIRGGLTHPTLPKLLRLSGSHKYPSNEKRFVNKEKTRLAPRPTLKPVAESCTIVKSKSRSDLHNGTLP